MQTNLDKLFKTSAEKEDGMEIEVSGVVFNCRRFHTNSPHVRAASLKFIKPVQRKIQLGLLSAEESRKLDVQLFVHSSLLGWSGLTGQDGNEILFSTEAAVNLFMALPDLYDLVLNEASNIQNFLEAEREELGNF